MKKKAAFYLITLSRKVELVIKKKSLKKKKKVQNTKAIFVMIQKKE